MLDIYRYITLTWNFYYGLLDVKFYCSLIYHLNSKLWQPESLYTLYTINFWILDESLDNFFTKSFFSSECCTNSRQSTFVSAIAWQLEVALIWLANDISCEVHIIIRNLEKLSWSVNAIVFVVVVIILTSFDIPFLVGTLLVKLFCSLAHCFCLNKPVREKYATSVSAITTEAAITFVWEIQKSFIYLFNFVLSTIICLHAVFDVLNTVPQYLSCPPFSLVTTCLFPGAS